MTKKILTVRRPSPLVRVWHSTGNPRMPLACAWMQADTTKPNPISADSSSDETGGLRLCA